MVLLLLRLAQTPRLGKLMTDVFVVFRILYLRGVPVAPSSEILKDEFRLELVQESTS